MSRAVGTRVCELVGPPGSGKSAILAALADAGVRTVDPKSKNAAGIGPMVAGVGAALRRYAGAREDRPRSRQHARWIARLRAARGFVTGDGIVVFDQGPVYTIARLTECTPSGTSAWLRGRIEHWGELLDLIVLVDAPDEVLRARIQGRAKSHAVKDSSAEQIDLSLARSRALYASIVGAMTADGGTRVLRIDTSAGSPQDASRAILAALDGVKG